MISKALVDQMRASGWLTITEAAHTFGLSHSTLYRWVAEGTLPSLRRGNFKRLRGGVLFVDMAALAGRNTSPPPTP